jgi:glycosyltransferase involved in cell wall biosynthesis
MRDAPVSVIIPVYNRAELLAEALACIGRQTWRPQEVIVADDGSTDDLEPVVARYPDTIVLRLAHAGAAAARNAGATRASQPFLAFFDADDLWPEARTECLLEPLLARADLHIMCGRMQQFRISPSRGVEMLGEPMASRLPSVSLIRRDAFWRAGPFSAQWSVGETIEWCARAADAGVTNDAVPDTVLLRRVHQDNLGKTVGEPGKAYVHMLRAVLERRRAAAPDGSAEK